LEKLELYIQLAKIIMMAVFLAIFIADYYRVAAELVSALITA
jgi:hypothetical protein